jgi:RimJ/RimL family protein N-acetyltransferase
MKYFPKIVGKRVYLSPLHPEDYEPFTKRMNDRNVSDGTGATSFITTLTSEKKRLESELNGNDTSYTFSIVKKEDEKLIGSIGLFEIQKVHRCATVGMMIGEVDEWRKGYGSDALNCMLEYAFNSLNFQNIMLNVHDFNEKAKKCYEKC